GRPRRADPRRRTRSGPDPEPGADAGVRGPGGRGMSTAAPPPWRTRAEDGRAVEDGRLLRRGDRPEAGLRVALDQAQTACDPRLVGKGDRSVTGFGTAESDSFLSDLEAERG